MKIGVLICVLLLVVTATPAANEDGGFELARCVPDCSQASFFIFSTSFGEYTIRNDGMGELGANGKRRPFYLHNKIRLVGRLKQMYFREYQSDLLLLYQVSDGKVYLARMIQESKKVRWFTLIAGNDMGSCVVEGDEAHCGDGDNLTKIDLNTGARVKTEKS
jgi:hypothetical protein